MTAARKPRAPRARAARAGKASAAAPAEAAANAPRGGVLVTGFEPFGGEDVNPSWEICRALPSAIGTARIHTLRVPTVFRAAIEVTAAALHLLRWHRRCGPTLSAPPWRA